MITDVVEKRVTRLLHQQAAEVVVPPPDPYSVQSVRSRPQGGSRPSPVRHRLVLVGVIALVAVAAVGAAVRWPSPGEVTAPAAEPTLGPGFDFDTQVGARLQATEIAVEANGQTFTPIGDDVDLSGDPGRPASDAELGYKTLELTWREHDVEMRIHLYFASDEADWWISEIRTYDGNDPGGWITTTGERARTPIGQPFIGEIDAGPLRIDGLVLEAFVPRLTSCDGSGTPGQIHLELSGSRPVSGELREDGGSGYATTVAILDAATCEPLRPEGVDLRAATAPPGVVAVETDGLVYDTEWAPDELYVSMSFVGAGQTTLTIEAVDQQTGKVLADVDIPVLVEDNENS